MVRTRFTTLHHPLRIHGTVTTLAALSDAGKIRWHVRQVLTPGGYQRQYFADYQNRPSIFCVRRHRAV